jgi:uncharacterized membrane protein YhiD involved in acid resistance
MHRGASVQGINTAATLWAAAGMGLAIGQGSYQLASFVLGTVLIVQFSLQWLANYINKRSGLRSPPLAYRLSLSFQPARLENVRNAWSEFAREREAFVTNYREACLDPSECVLEASFELSAATASEAASVAQRFAHVAGSTRANCEFARVPTPEQD